MTACTCLQILILGFWIAKQLILTTDHCGHPKFHGGYFVVDGRGLTRSRAANCDECVWATKINFSQVFAGQAVSIKEVHDDIWLVSFTDYDLGYFDLETRVLEPLENPFGPKVLPMS